MPEGAPNQTAPLARLAHRAKDPTGLPTGSSGADESLARSAVRRVSARLIPFLFLCYICAHLDRSNLGIASLQMNRDLGFTAAVYGFGAGIFYVGYALFEVPSNMILARVGARRWIARIMITWGILAACMSMVRTPTSFYALRFLLGVGEAGFFPGVVYYMTWWFPAAARARAVSRFMLAIPVASIISGLLAGPLLALHGRLGFSGWQWLFLVEGLPTVLLGIALLFYLTDHPENAEWLPPMEKAWLVRELQRERAQRQGSHGSNFRKALVNRRAWQLGYIWAAFYMCANAYTFWAPQIIKGLFERSPAWIGNLLAVLSGIGVVTIFLNGVHSDRRRERWLHVATPLGIAAIAWLALATPAPSGLKLLALVGIYAGANSIYGPFWCLPSTFLSGEGAAGGLALVSSIGALGGAFGPNVLGMAQAITHSQRAGFCLLAALLGTAVMLALGLRRSKDIAATY